jgi:hypothetical protein
MLPWSGVRVREAEGPSLPYLRIARSLLEDFRAVERDLRTAPVDSDEAKRLMAELVMLREEYERLMIEARANFRPIPPFPTDTDPD